MHFSDSDIEELTLKYKERLKASTDKLPQGAPTLSELQGWMSENLIENEEVLLLALKKMGKGEKVKKNARNANAKKS
jgi:hypothetical protein